MLWIWMCLFQQTQRGIHGSQGYVREEIADPLKNLANRRVIGRVDHDFGYRQTLWRKSYPQRSQLCCQMLLRGQNVTLVEKELYWKSITPRFERRDSKNAFCARWDSGERFSDSLPHRGRVCARPLLVLRSA